MLPLKSKGSSRWTYYPLGVVKPVGIAISSTLAITVVQIQDIQFLTNFSEEPVG